MALFDKLFSTKRKLDDSNHQGSRDCSSREITLEQVRLLLFKECDWRGRKLLFDSSSIERVPADKHAKQAPIQVTDTSSVIEISEGFAYMYKGPAKDASTLGEMIFGAVAMNYRGVSLKIHIMDDPQRLMCTKVFCVPAARKNAKSERKVSGAEQLQENSSRSRGDIHKCTKPLSMPRFSTEEDMALNFSFDRKDSGFYGDHSPQSSVSSTFDYFSMLDIWDGNNNCQDDFYSFHSPPGRKLSACSAGSWQRRTFRSVGARFPLTQPSHLLAVPSANTNLGSCDSQIYSNSSASGTCDSLSSTTSSVSTQRRNKLGLALLITVTDSTELELVQRCVEHSPQLQALVCRLRVATMEAGSGQGFVATLYKAAVAAARWLSELVYGPRIPPVWLSLTSHPAAGHNKMADIHKMADLHKMADSLVADLCSVLAAADTKHTNFFVSTLVTHVLTYHLGWVGTVSPYCVPRALCVRGAVGLAGGGVPQRVARTILHGTHQRFLDQLLLVLTYFIRCGDIGKTHCGFEDAKAPIETVLHVDAEEKPKSSGMKRTATRAAKLEDMAAGLDGLGATSASASRDDIATVSNLDRSLSDTMSKPKDRFVDDRPLLSGSRSSISSSDSSLAPSEETERNQNVVFVLGDDERLIGLKNKSGGGKSVKKSSKVHEQECSEQGGESKCCAQQSQHSKTIKHSGFKFEFDKYPQIVTNYMKSKNLEILDRHYIGKPGNLKLDNYRFDPEVVPPLREERCETCRTCRQLEATLQTPTNASELEYMNDVPRQSEPQYATVLHPDAPKSFVRMRKENTVVVNIVRPDCVPNDATEGSRRTSIRREKGLEVRRVVEIPMVRCEGRGTVERGFLMAGVTAHYVPDLILQGTLAEPKEWEKELKRDLDITSYLNRNFDTPVQAVAIVGDTNKWEVSVVGCGRECGGMSALVGAMLDALPHMRRASLPAAQCLLFIEGKLRELCVLSKTLADMLMSTDFCDMATLTKTLNIDVNDVPLLLAVATTHTPQVARRYGITFR